MGILDWHLQDNEIETSAAPSSYSGMTVAVNSSPVLPSQPEVLCQGNAALHNHFGLTRQLKLGLTYKNCGFHPDGTHNLQTDLPVVTSMYCLKAPKYGGNTFFACGRLAFANATPDLQSKARRLRVHYISDPELGVPIMQNGIRRVGYDISKSVTASGKSVQPVHPLVRKHPETGDESVYVSCNRVDYMEADATETEPAMYLNTTASFELIDALLRGVTTSPLVYAHKWREDEFLIWDNRLTLHAPDDEEGMDGERLHHRVRLFGSASANRDLQH